MLGRLVVALAGAGIFAASALAAATPISPPPGAVVKTAHPQFNWTVPFNEQSDAILIANKPDVTPAGKFYDENLVDVDVFTTPVTEWSPSSPLYAGRYWWNVWSNDVNTFANFYSTPAAFTFPVSLRLVGVKTKRYLFLHALGFHVRWTANMRRPLVRVRLLRGNRIVWRASETDFNTIGSRGSTSFVWYRPKRVKQGTGLTLRASISSGGITRTRSLAVRAP